MNNEIRTDFDLNNHKFSDNIISDMVIKKLQLISFHSTIEYYVER